MRCLLCESLSFTHICQACQESFLTPSIYKRKILNNIEVLSFYKYQDIKKLLHTKHTDLGYYIYKILAQNSLKKFAQQFEFPHAIPSIAIDDKTESGYAHTAILNKSLKSKNIKPLYNKLRAKNSISYSGKSKEFRLLNPREFELQFFEGEDVILVDDIITTGATFTQAIQTMQRNNKNTLFCLALADVSQK
ncbi:MAG: ComF family protein [Epsilonproteobacteria bacterium]|nr:ComF family protein [Campylobacterota bacterium]OIO14890.1 MAG: phosphoribosyltransferase [Helicobacteraceae bacterium CG1_02_36_14]PIP11536.1 MAG: phosphoribosyltransferase [Sulfurimonas sp. CG23_combo_of_CG06-09_8_20_14_all_36_33]PIS25492.1 MAG: ComF family protein [Sulfurimonas sp. CG08_land_8_20_14_0_20_36_33]PIU35648.1 MAG: ComF family protein [Sulfurimonas sp. CG07_land_8_20_14_0_80_36_56]PIV05227.1 MAG: ComF family protein [Sulfurimonas sp. CG03_land_8_20_14_0_80_36_25]PIV36117.1 MA